MVKFSIFKKSVATLYSYRNNPGGITTGKQGGKSFTVCLYFFGGNELHITRMPDQNSGLYMKHFFFLFFCNHIELNSVWQNESKALDQDYGKLPCWPIKDEISQPNKWDHKCMSSQGLWNQSFVAHMPKDSS